MLSPVIPIPESVKSPEKYIKKPKEETKPAKPASFVLAKPIAGVYRKDNVPVAKVATPSKRPRTASKTVDQSGSISPASGGAELGSEEDSCIARQVVGHCIRRGPNTSVLTGHLCDRQSAGEEAKLRSSWSTRHFWRL